MHTVPWPRKAYFIKTGYGEYSGRVVTSIRPPQETIRDAPDDAIFHDCTPPQETKSEPISVCSASAAAQDHLVGERGLVWGEVVET